MIDFCRHLPFQITHLPFEHCVGAIETTRQSGGSHRIPPPPQQISGANQTNQTEPGGYTRCRRTCPSRREVQQLSALVGHRPPIHAPSTSCSNSSNSSPPKKRAWTNSSPKHIAARTPSRLSSFMVAISHPDDYSNEVGVHPDGSGRECQQKWNL
jgi:hypothetical protein